MVTARFGLSLRRACRLVGLGRSTQQYRSRPKADDAPLRQRLRELAEQRRRFGAPRLCVLLRREGWRVNHKRVERIWQREGLKVPKRQPKRGRLWLADGSCIRLRPLHRNHVWAYDFVSIRTYDGRKVRLLTMIDEFTRECLAIRAGRRMTSQHVIDLLAELFILKGVPDHLRSDNGPEMTASAVREWLAGVGVKTLYIEPGSPWEKGYCESFNGKLRDELLDREIFYSLREAQILTERWRHEYRGSTEVEIHTVRPHSSLGYRPPAPEAILPSVAPAAATT